MGKLRQSYRKTKIGDIFGRLTTIEIIGKSSNNSNMWKCVCECGAEHVVRSSHLTCGNVKSCGCLEREVNQRQNLEPSMAACRKCNTEKEWPIDFAIRHRPNGVKKMSNHCKECQKKSQKESIEKRGVEYNETQSEQRKIRKSYQHRIIFTHYKNNPCVDCRENDVLVLQFDHVRGTKSFGIGGSLGKVTDERLVAEIAKCDVRCANCHQRRHALEDGRFSSFM